MIPFFRNERQSVVSAPLRNSLSEDSHRSLTLKPSSTLTYSETTNTQNNDTLKGYNTLFSQLTRKLTTGFEKISEKSENPITEKSDLSSSLNERDVLTDGYSP